jgi:hypothetical protein
MNNFFTNVRLFKNSVAQTIYATGTIKSNHVGIPITLKDSKSFNRMTQDI